MARPKEIDDQVVLRLYRQHTPVANIAAALDVSRSAVYAALRRTRHRVALLPGQKVGLLREALASALEFACVKLGESTKDLLAFGYDALAITA